MLNPDTNNFIKILYSKSAKMQETNEKFQFVNLSFFEEDQQLLSEYEEEFYDQININDYQKLHLQNKKQGIQTHQALYSQMKRYTASDVYLFTNPSQIQVSKYHPTSITYLEYSRKKELLEIIEQMIKYQDSQGLVDFHPNYNDLSDDLKKHVDQQSQQLNYGGNLGGQRVIKSSNSKNPRIRNILHQSLQPYHPSYCNLTHSEGLMKLIWERKNKISLDNWGKRYASSPSNFLWLPAQFVYLPDEKIYKVKGNLFHPLEESPLMPELKKEVSQLLTYMAPALKSTQEYFSQFEYRLSQGNYFSQKQKPNFDEKIHAIVKITEMTIDPHSTYTGQWHVEGYSSDNILYTCLYVIQQDEQLKEGKLKFKRASRLDDAPIGLNEYKPSYSQAYCPDYETLCDPHKLIPLGFLEIKENLMIVFPNQNIHKVKGFKNDTDVPLKRKIVAFFVVNHEAQPFTVNDVNYTQPLSFIKEKRLLDMYERSKNKQTETQYFNYCEH